MNCKSTDTVANSALLLTSILWGIGFVAAKAALESFGALNILIMRFGISSLLMLLIFLKKIKKATSKDAMYGMLIGAIQFVGLFVQLQGLKYTSAGKQSFLIAIYVVFVPFISWIASKKNPGIKSFFVGILTLIGVAMISLNDTLNIEYGDCLSILFSLIFAVQIVIVGRFVKKTETISMTFYQFLTVGVLSLLASLITHAPWGEVSTTAFIGMAYLIIFNTVIAFSLQNFAQKHTSATHTSVLISVESIVGLLCSVFFYKEIITLKMLAGCAVILIAVAISNSVFKNRSRAKSII